MFLKLILKSRRLERRKNDLITEKITALKQFKGEEVKLGLKQKYRRCHVDTRRKIRKLFSFPKKSILHRISFNTRHEGTCENFTAKSIAGFIGGFFLTYIFFMFFVLQLNFKLSTATIMCAVFGSILTLGLAFSYKVRCVVFLVLPQFFSKKGRQALLAYAYILAITGPAKNTLNNMSILGESMACGQEQLKAAVKQILDVIKKPFYAIRDAIKQVVKTVKEIVTKIKEILLTIKRIIMSLVQVIKSAFQFIARLMNVCNNELGTPFERCTQVFEDAITDCNAKLGPLFNWLCNITYLVKAVCYIVKPIDFICFIMDFISDTVGIITTKVKQFIRHIRTMFYVRIKFSHSYHFESNHSKSMSEITTGIVTEIKQRSSGLMKFFDFISSAASIFFIFMVVKVLYYRHKFLTNERFDNKFITKDFREIDVRRAQLGMETVLPLNHRERQLYITTNSMRLVKKERSQLSQSAMVLLMATLKLATHMATDYSLYWIMTLIRYYGRFQSKVPTPNIPTLHITGEGFLANLLKGIVKAFQPIGINLEIDTIPCLPDPIPPDYDRYIQIGSLLVLCWFLAIFEPYGLRFRHKVMCYYHPLRAKERAIWLYNNIMRSRSSFLKFARRQLRRKVKSDKSISKVTLMEFLRAKLDCKLCRLILGSKKQAACLLCGEVFRENDKKKPIYCQTPKCPGVYCEQCFSDLQNKCTVCLDPIQYADLSDVSEERDSSEGSEKLKKKDRKKKRRCLKRIRNRNKSKSKRSSGDDTDTDVDEGDDDKKGLIKKANDSDYYSSTTNEGDTTDYSYSYQNTKDVTKISTNPQTRAMFYDLEKQHIPNYSCMGYFRKDGISPKCHKSLCGKKDDDTDITTAEDFDSSSSNISELNEIPKEIWKSKSLSTREIDYTESKRSYKNVFEQGDENENINETTFIYTPKSMASSKSKEELKEKVMHVDTYFFHDASDNEYSEVPKLNLDFSNDEDGLDPNEKSSQRFINIVKYSSECETDRSTGSSSVITEVGSIGFSPSTSSLISSLFKMPSKMTMTLSKAYISTNVLHEGKVPIIATKFSEDNISSFSPDSLEVLKSPNNIMTSSSYSGRVAYNFNSSSSDITVPKSASSYLRSVEINRRRVKNYYKQVNQENKLTQTIKIRKKPKNIFKKLWNLFTHKKKPKYLLD